MSSSRTIPVAIVLSGLLVAWAVYSSLGGQWPPFGLGGAVHGNPSLVRPVDTTDHILGNPAAPVMIVAYCDFDSEYCKGFTDTLKQIVATEGARGEVAVTYRAYPLTAIHPNAPAHARAAECAARVAGNDAFWKFSDELYAAQPADPAQYGVFAKAAGVPGDAFATCYAEAESEVSARVEADKKNALDVGATGVPYSLILTEGHTPAVVDGAYSYDALREAVDQTLGRAQ